MPDDTRANKKTMNFLLRIVIFPFPFPADVALHTLNHTPDETIGLHDKTAAKGVSKAPARDYVTAAIGRQIGLTCQKSIGISPR